MRPTPTPTPTPPEGSARASLQTILVSDLVDSTLLAQNLGDERIADIFRRHDRLARDLLHEHSGREADRTDGFLMLFERPLDAVAYSLDFHQAMAQLSEEVGVELGFRVGIHLGEVVLIETPPEDVARGAKPLEVEGLAKPTAARLMSVAQGRQTLLSQAAFDVARRAAVGSEMGDGTLAWLAHGDYMLKGITRPTPIFEVGVEGFAPLTAPPDTEKVRRVLEQDTLPGWRPAPGMDIPSRGNWVIQRKLGEGGFGEVWLVAHRKTGDRRVYKFCFERRLLRMLQREITIFRLLKEALGERDDISRIVDWNFDQEPFYIESEYTAGGDLLVWAEEQGGIDQVPLATRLEIVAQAAEALGAAHSVGVLHKDVKPANLLVRPVAEGPPRIRLTDFGIGRLTDERHLVESGITVLGLTEMATPDLSTTAGTRLYQAPEVVAGQPATMQADVYALGVLLYQSVAGDFSRALAPGWERDIDDEDLREDIAWAVDGSPQRRLANAGRLAERLRSLDDRRRERLEAQRLEAEAEAQRLAAARQRQRLRWGGIAFAVLLLVSLGLLVLERGRAREAERANREAERANREAETASEVTAFVVDLFELSSPDKALGQTITARELLERGAEKIDALSGQPRVQARLQHVLGVIHYQLGLYEAAEPLLMQALETRRTLEVEPLELAESEQVLGDLLRSQGRFEVALGHYLEALSVRRAESSTDDRQVAAILNGLGIAYWRLGRLEEAETTLEQARAIFEADRQPGDTEIETTLNNLANIYWSGRRLEEAEEVYRRILEVGRESLDANDPDLASRMHNLALALRDLGRFDEAEPLLEEALTIWRTVLGDDHPRVANGLKNQGLLYLRMGRLDDAAVTVESAASTLQRSGLGEDHFLSARILVAQAELALERGDGTTAVELASRAVEILAATFGAENSETQEAREILERARADVGSAGG